MCADEYWQAVVERNHQYNDVFVYAVRSTKVYCRPSCAARRPRRENVVFFCHSAAAEECGFHPCLRCYPDQNALEAQVVLMQRICEAISAHPDKLPQLAELANQFHVSLYHLQRTFKRVVGVTPRQYADAQRLGRLKAQLMNGDSVADALYAAGYGASSSLYEKAAAQLGMTPTTYQRGGKGMDITYTVVLCSLGYLLVATTDKGVCAVKLGDTVDDLEKVLYGEFKQARIVCNHSVHKEWVQAILDFIAGKEPNLDLPLDVRGTAFQRQVWQALQQIPYGETRTYTDIADEIGQPHAVRAVGNACGANPCALIVPCHRVLRSDRTLGGYRWGSDRKQKLLNQEAQYLEHENS